METDITLKVEKRELVGKKVKRLRAEGWIPGVVYGRDMESVAVKVPRVELTEVYHRAGTSTMIGLTIGRQRKKRPTFIREVQRDPISLEILHVDLETVDLLRPITAQVPVILVGEAPVSDTGLGVLTRGTEEVEVHCLPADVPARIEVDLSPIERTDQAIYVRDLVVPEEVQILTDPGTTVVYVTRLRIIEDEEEEVEDEEAVAAEDEEGEESAEE
jgi:large subunit ribosomal protein L25